MSPKNYSTSTAKTHYLLRRHYNPEDECVEEYIYSTASMWLPRHITRPHDVQMMTKTDANGMRDRLTSRTDGDFYLTRKAGS